MIDKPEAFRVATANGATMNVEYNWSPYSGDNVKLIINGEEAIVAATDLTQVALISAGEEDQERLIPSKIMKRRTFRKTQTLKLSKDMPKGSILTIPAEFSIDLPENINPKTL